MVRMSTLVVLLRTSDRKLAFWLRFFLGVPGNPRRRESLPRPHIGIRAQPAGVGAAPRPPSGVSHFVPFQAKTAHHRYEYEPGHACCALLEAGRPRAGRSRFA